MRYWGHGEEGAPDVATLADEVLLPMVRNIEHDPCRRDRRRFSMVDGLFTGWGNYGGYAVTKAIKRPK